VESFSIPSTSEQLRTTSAGKSIETLVNHLVRNVGNRTLINALLTLTWHFNTLDVDDHRLNETRASACEMTAYKFLSRISEREAVDFCLYELPPPPPDPVATTEACDVDEDEHSSLLPQFRARDSQISTPGKPENRRTQLLRSLSRVSLGASSLSDDGQSDREEDPTQRLRYFRVCWWMGTSSVASSFADWDIPTCTTHEALTRYHLNLSIHFLVSAQRT
jgi:hypothetical protein